MIRFEDIAEKLTAHFPQADLDLLKRAYVFSAKAHANQFRNSGDPYLAHPLEVANILAEMGLDEIAVTVGLLHDVVEDTLTDIATIRKYFGEPVALIVEGVTKIGQITFTSTEQRQAENFRKLLLAMSDDVRVILVKLADRLHNMRTLKHLSPDQRSRIARETNEIYVPIANRLGMGKIKSELEDLAFYHLEPEQYREIIGLIEKRRAAGNKLLKDVEGRLRHILAENNIPAVFQARIKRVASIHAKMKRQRISFDEVYDFLAVRVITDSVPNCYAVLGVVHTAWKLVPGRFKDYIGMPRPNGYQSVHTTIMSEAGIPCEIQIRTEEMHQIAEGGIAAHWMYKEGKITKDDTDRRFAWLRHLLEWQKEVQNPHEFLTNLKIDLYPEEVYTFTPKGDVIILPKGATPVDFAYEIHTDVGHQCTQARVNARIVPLKHQLRNGEIVEIITAKDHHPSRDWLTFVISAKARNKIRGWLNKYERQQAVEFGRKIMEKETHRFRSSLKSVLGHADFAARLSELGVAKAEDLYAQIGFGKVSARKFLENLLGIAAEAPPPEGAIKSLVKDVFSLGRDKLLVSGMSDILISRARCCSPIPGEEVVGYISRGRGVIVHAKDCPNVEKMLNHPEKEIEVSWGKAQKGATFPVRLLVYTDDRKGLIADISNKITKMDVNIRDFRAHSKAREEGVFQIALEVEDRQQLDKIIRMLKSIKNVRDVERADYSKT